MKPEILIVDDDSDLRTAAAELLQQEGFVVHEAEDGTAGLHAVLRLVPDLVLLDLNLPHLEGPEVLRRIRASPHTADVPVVVVSGQLREYGPRLEGLTYHAALQKPCMPEELIASVRIALAQSAGAAPLGGDDAAA